MRYTSLKRCALFPLPTYLAKVSYLFVVVTPRPPPHSLLPYSLYGNAIIRLTHSEWTLTQFHLCCPGRRGNGVLMCQCALSREASIPQIIQAVSADDRAKATTLSSSHSIVTSACYSGVRISHIRFLTSTPFLPTVWVSRKKRENILPFTRHYSITALLAEGG